MKISTKEVRAGKYTNKIVWICHYNRPDMNKKALRNVAPIKVLIRSNSELPTSKTIYYSDVHFSPLNKTLQPTSKVISPVDITGFRLCCGNEVFVFNNEQECNDCWNSQIKHHIEEIEELIMNAADHWKDEKRKLVDAIL